MCLKLEALIFLYYVFASPKILSALAGAWNSALTKSCRLRTQSRTRRNNKILRSLFFPPPV